MTLQVGVTAWTGREGWRAAALAEQAAWAEARGFHSLWLPENHFGDSRAIPAPLTLLAAAAARTETIRLATTSYLLPIRNPILAAEEVAVLDQLSGGRVILGVGRGMGSDLFNAFDVPVADKRQLFQMNLEAMLAALSGKPLLPEAEGTVTLSPLPLQKPHPPIWLAAFGPLALRQAGRLGLPYLASPLESLSVLEDNYAIYRTAMDEQALPIVETVPVMRSVFISDSQRLVKDVGQALQATIPPQLLEKAGALEDWAVLGDRMAVRDKLLEYSETLGMTHLIARGKVSRLAAAEQSRSHDLLLAIADEL